VPVSGEEQIEINTNVNAEILLFDLARSAIFIVG
jgi:hypothetical protein